MRRKKEVETTSVPAITPSGASTIIPIERLIEYRRKGLTMKEIGLLCECSEANVSKRLKHVDMDGLDVFSKHKAEVFESKQRELINVLTPDKLNNMSASQAIVGAAILQDKIQTMRGNATEIIDHRVITASLEEITKRMRDQGMITSDGDVIDV